jgi:hypothetical protein
MHIHTYICISSSPFGRGLFVGASGKSVIRRRRRRKPPLSRKQRYHVDRFSKVPYDPE